MLAVVFCTAWYAGGYYDHLTDRAERADKAGAAEPKARDHKLSQVLPAGAGGDIEASASPAAPSVELPAGVQQQQSDGAEGQGGPPVSPA